MGLIPEDILDLYKRPVNPPTSTGNDKRGDDSVASVLDDEFSKLGYPSTSRLSILGDVGRENSWDRNTIFRGHQDPKNNAPNRGIISWQGDRQAALNNHLKKEGVYGKNDDSELRGMARFMDDELRTKYPNIHKKLLNPSSTYDASESLRNYIQYVPDEPYNSPDPDFRVKNNRVWAERAKQLGLGSIATPNFRSFDDVLSAYGGTNQAAAPAAKSFDDITNLYTQPSTGTTPTSPAATPQPSPPPVPESPDTIRSQIAAMNDANTPRAAVLTTDPAQNALFGNMDGVLGVPMREGMLWVNTAKAKKKYKLKTADEIRHFVEVNPAAMNTLGVRVETVADTSQGPAVHTQNPDGTEVNSSIVTNPENARAQAELDQANHPGSVSQVVDAQDVVNARRNPFPPPVDSSLAGSQEYQDVESGASPGPLPADQYPLTNAIAGHLKGEKPDKHVERATAPTSQAYPEKDFKVWAKFKKLPANAEARKTYEADLAAAEKEGFGKDVEVSAEVDAPEQAVAADTKPETPKKADRFASSTYDIPLSNKRGSYTASYQEEVASRLSSEMEVPYEVALSVLKQYPIKFADKRGRDVTEEYLANIGKSGESHQAAVAGDVKRQVVKAAADAKERQDIYDAKLKDYSEKDPMSVADLKARKDAGFEKANGVPIDEAIDLETDAYNQTVADKALSGNYKDPYEEGIKSGEVPPEARYNIRAPIGAMNEELQAKRLQFAKDVFRDSESFVKYRQNEDRIREEYKYRPLAEPLEFARNFGAAVPKAVAAVLKTADIALNVNPLKMALDSARGKDFTMDETALSSVGNGINKYLETTRNKDLKDKLYVTLLPDTLGQLATQIAAGVVSGGATVPTLIGASMGAAGQYDDAAQFKANDRQKVLAAAVGALAAVPDALLFGKWFKAADAAEKTGFFRNLSRSLMARLGVEYGDETAKAVTRDAMTQFTRNILKNAGFEGVQEVTENKIDDWLASVTYDPSEKRKAKLTTITDDDVTSFLGGMIGGAGGGAIETYTEHMAESAKEDLFEKANAEIEQLLAKGELTPEKALAIKELIAKAAEDANKGAGKGETVVAEEAQTGQEPVKTGSKVAGNIAPQKTGENITNSITEPAAVTEKAAEKTDEPETVHKFSSTQVDLPPDVAKNVIETGNKLIPETELYTDPDDPSYGREENPHVTVKYGLHTEDATEVRDFLAGEKPFTATLGKISIFPGKEDTPYDVVKIEAKSPDLHRLNKLIADNTKVTDTFPTYEPHVTLAYVKKGKGAKYVGNADLEGKDVKFDSITFSSKTGETVAIPLGGVAEQSTSNEGQKEATESKEPWQMTKAEHAASTLAPRKLSDYEKEGWSRGQIQWDPTDFASPLFDTMEGAQKWADDHLVGKSVDIRTTQRGDEKKWVAITGKVSPHARAVWAAHVRDGLSVPQEVLADYPDLAQAGTKEAEIVSETGPQATTSAGKIKEQRDTARRQAETSTVSGLPNKLAFEKAQPRIDADPDLEVTSIDLQNFKTINDKNGHIVGDQALNEAGQDLLHAAKAKDPKAQVFHPSGDEFLIASKKGTGEQIKNAADKVFSKRKYGDVQGSMGGHTANTYEEAEAGLQSAKSERKMSFALDKVFTNHFEKLGYDKADTRKLADDTFAKIEAGTDAELGLTDRESAEFAKHYLDRENHESNQKGLQKESTPAGKTADRQADDSGKGNETQNKEPETDRIEIRQGLKAGDSVADIAFISARPSNKVTVTEVDDYKPKDFPGVVVEIAASSKDVRELTLEQISQSFPSVEPAEIVNFHRRALGLAGPGVYKVEVAFRTQEAADRALQDVKSLPSSGSAYKQRFIKEAEAAAAEKTVPTPAKLKAGDRVSNGTYKGTVFQAKDGTLKIERAGSGKQIHPMSDAWVKTPAQIKLDKQQAKAAKKGKRKDELPSDALGDPDTPIYQARPHPTNAGRVLPDPLTSESEDLADDDEHARALVEVRMPVDLEAQPGHEKTKVSHVDVVKSYSKVLDDMGRPTPIRVGRMAQKNARGIYKVGAEVIRLKEAGNIPTAAHEVFHGVQKVMFGEAHAGALKPIPKAALKELVRLGKDLYGEQRPGGGYRTEGFAEFGRYYLTQGDLARQKAPAMYDYFTNEFLAENPDFAKSLANAKETTEAYQKQGAANRASANMSQTSIRKRLKEATRKLIKEFPTQVIDELTPLLNLSKQIEKIQGKPLPAGDNPGMVASYLRGNAQAKTHYMVFDGMIDAAGNKVGPPLRDAVAKIRDRQTDFVRYLWAKRALERWSVNKNPGMSKEDAAFLVDQLASPEFELAAQGVYEWNAGVLNYVKGMLPDLAPTVDNIIESSVNYVPLMREMSDVEGNDLAGKYNGFGGNAMFKMTGSGRRVKNIFPQMIANAERMLTMAHKRKVLDTIARLDGIEGVGSLLEQVPRSQVPNTVVLESIEKSLIEAGADLKDVDLDQAVTFFTPAQFPKGTDPIIPIMKDGKMVWYQVPSDLYNALSGLDLYRLPKVADILLGAPTRLFRLGTTGLRASFSLFTNPTRDIQTVFTQSQSKNPAKLMLNYFKALGGAINPKRLAGHNNAAIDTFYRLGVNLAQPLGADEAVTSKYAKQVFQSMPRRIVSSPINAIRELFSVTESIPRVAEIETIGREIGWKPGDPMTFDQAVQLGLAGKQSTVDFSASGKAGKVANQIIPFLNANIQGNRSFARAFKRNPVGTTLKGMAALMLPTLLLWWRNKDKEWYKEMPEREKNMFWNIEAGDEIIQIPRAQEFGGLFASLPESIANSWYQKDPEGFKASMAYLFDLAAPPVEPVVVKIGHEQWANQVEFFDKPIVPKAEEDLPPSEQSGQYTSQVAKWLGKHLPDWKIAGVPINSPRRIDAAIRELGGGVASDITQIGNTKSPADWTASDIPVIGRAFRRGGELGTGNKTTDKFYDELTRVRQIAASREQDETPDQERYRLQIEDAAKALSELRKASLSVDAKKKEEIVKLERSIADRVMRGESPYAPHPRDEEKADTSKQKQDSNRLSRYVEDQALVPPPPDVVNDSVVELQKLPKDQRAKATEDRIRELIASGQIEAKDAVTLRAGVMQEKTKNLLQLDAADGDQFIEILNRAMKSADDAERQKLMMRTRQKWAGATSAENKAKYKAALDRYQ